MVTWMLVALAMLGAGLVGAILSIVIISATNLRGSPLLGFLNGAVSAAVTRGCVYMEGTGIFRIRECHPSTIPMVVVAGLLLLNDSHRFAGTRSPDSGRSLEMGHICGGVLAFALFLWLRMTMV